MNWTLFHAFAMLAAAAAAWVARDARIAATAGAASLSLLVGLRARHWTPDGRFGGANAVTSVRVALIVAFAMLPQLGPDAALLLLGFLALDGVDGWVARRAPVTASDFGAAFDMETDALLVLVAGLRLSVEGRVGPFIIVPGLLRYLYVVTVAAFPEARGEAPRSRLGRAAFVLMASSLVASAWPLEPIHRPLAAVAALGIVASFARGAFWSFAAGSRRPA
jgi:phosphatidylglycerophosphate synthase